MLFNWSAQFFQAAPIICFAYQCHLTSIAVYKELSSPTPARMGAVTFIALGIFYTSAGLFGYLTFGAETQSDVLVLQDVVNDWHCLVADDDEECGAAAI